MSVRPLPLISHSLPTLPTFHAKRFKIRGYVQKYQDFRFKVYDFLDHPTSKFTVGSTLYHVSVFISVLIAVILGASTESLKEHQWITTIYSLLETSLAIFFLLEFMVRMWAISADAKYMGFRGHLQYLRKFVCITDITIIIVTFAILLIDKRYVTEKTMDYLRFIQIMRLFHIDRQMKTWKLIKDMIQISRRELLASYYITFILFVLMANLVYYTEHLESNPWSFFVNSSTVSESPINTLAHAWWFSVVTITTIGYGDLVPTFWFSKVVVSILGFLAYCTFVTASTQISVGLTLMMEEDYRNKHKKRLKNSAASLIQNWWRYHMASALLNVKKTKAIESIEMRDNRYQTTYFKDCCYKLYLTAENLSKMRAVEKKVKENREKRKRMHKSIHNEWKNLGFGATTQIVIQPTGLPQNTVRKASVPQLSRHMSLPVQDLHSASISHRAPIHQATTEEMSKYYNTVIPSIEHQSTISSSIDLSDSDHIYALHEHQSVTSLSAVDEKLLIRYKPLLRFIFFLVFQNVMKKFQRIRKANIVLEMEAESTEQIHERDQKISELELNFTKIVGKTSQSLLKNNGEKLPINDRLETCEKRMFELEKKAEELERLAGMIARLAEGPQNPRILPHLPPAPPGRLIGRRLRRQSKTTVLEEDE